MIKQHLPKLIVGIFVVFSFVILLFMTNETRNENRDVNNHLEYSTGRISRIIADHTFFPEQNDPLFYTDSNSMRMGTILFEVEMIRGSFAGQVLEASYFMNSPANVYFEVGDRVSVRIFEFEGEISTVEIRHPERSELLIGAIVLFLVFLCLIGGKRGMFSVLSLIFTLFCIMFLLIPLTIAGYPVILMTFIIITLITVTSITLLAGITPKSISAILGCLIGTLFATIFAYVVGSLVQVSGYNMSNVAHIIHLADNVQISGLFTSSVLVASIGAVMDTSMSIASAMEEVKQANSDITTRKLFKSGFNIGRDIMGTMSNTLILAFIGGSLSLLLFMHTTNTSFSQFINNDFIAMEIIKGIAGSLGIILTAPFTTLIASKLLTTQNHIKD